ncbi:MAG TPA: hypothetical protein VF429_09735, partial [Anaerolineae bacterium]
AGRRTNNPRAPRVALAPLPMAVPVAAAVQPTPAADARSNTVAQKIIRLQEWLAGHPAHKSADDADAVMPLAVGARPSRVLPEEKRVGWTD